MKNILYFLICVWIFSIINSCGNKSNNDTIITKNEWAPEADSLYEHGKALKSLVYIDEEDARDLARSYNRHIRSRFGIGTKKRSSAIWFDSSVVRQLYEALYTGPVKHRLDGIRIYFGRYPDNYVDKPRQGKLTAFILLTVKNSGVARHRDTFYFPKPLTGWNKNNPVHLMSINHGELCPDVCDSVLNLREEY